MLRIIAYWLLALGLTLAIVYIASSQDFTDPPYETWDATLESRPAGSDPISQGDDWLNDNKREIRRRLEVEHNFSTIDPGSSDASAVFTDLGRHRGGAARIFWDATAPTRIDVTDNQTVPSAALDDGRMWRDSDGGAAAVLMCYDVTAAAWTDCIGGFEGQDPNNPNVASPANPRLDLKSGSNSALQFTKDAADPMDIHAHGSRHLPTYSGGSWTDSADNAKSAGIPTSDSTCTVGGSLAQSCGTLNDVSLPVMVAANTGTMESPDAPAWDSVAEVKLDLTGRSGTSQALVLANVNLEHNTGAASDLRLACLNIRACANASSAGDPSSCTTLLGSAQQITELSCSSVATTSVCSASASVMVVATGLTATTQFISIQASRPETEGCLAIASNFPDYDASIVVMDLGAE